MKAAGGANHASARAQADPAACAGPTGPPPAASTATTAPATIRVAVRAIATVTIARHRPSLVPSYLFVRDFGAVRRIGGGSRVNVM
ncbi:hypothetical protein AB0933_08960 [Streptomyces venezuelae]|uniref:hypothetical protein n=1 Tax=Streptomyces venezuelae TaxID=54571 RepID=UPI003455A381